MDPKQEHANNDFPAVLQAVTTKLCNLFQILVYEYDKVLRRPKIHLLFSMVVCSEPMKLDNINDQELPQFFLIHLAIQNYYASRKQLSLELSRPSVLIAKYNEYDNNSQTLILYQIIIRTSLLFFTS